MFWRVQSFPPCRYHVFLSHCSDDKKWLVNDLFQRLQTLGIIPWLDRHHFPVGPQPFEALRNGILHCRHVIYLVTHATLTVGRGWQAIEKCYGNLLQEQFSFTGSELARVELPLFFVPQDTPELPRSIWFPYVSRGKFCSAAGNEVDWAAKLIDQFVKQAASDAIYKVNSVQVAPTTLAAILACLSEFERQLLKPRMADA